MLNSLNLHIEAIASAIDDEKLSNPQHARHLAQLQNRIGK